MPVSVTDVYQSITVVFPSSIVELKDIRKSYRDLSGERTILSDLSLQLDAGDFVSITGPSGSGKSTLLNLLGGVDLPDSGSVTICGDDISKKSESDRTLFRRHNIGFIFQFFNLIPTLTVAENLRLPLELCHTDYSSDLIKDWLERFDLSLRGESYPDVLSGGEQQRVAVIRAAINRPSLIIADEPTGNLDKTAGAEVLDLLQSVAASGTCVVMATHSDIAASCASRNMILQDGKLAVTQ